MESDIHAAQEAALEAVETDSIMTGTSANPEDSSLFGKTYWKQDNEEQILIIHFPQILPWYCSLQCLEIILVLKKLENIEIILVLKEL